MSRIRTLATLRAWGFLLLPLVIVALSFAWPTATPVVVAVFIALGWPLDDNNMEGSGWY